MSVSDLYISRIGPHISFSRIGRSIVGIYKSLTQTHYYFLVNMLMKQFDRIVCLPGRVRRGQSSNTHVLSLASSVAVLRSNQVVDLPGFGVA
jgi:hypothetical protein